MAAIERIEDSIFLIRGHKVLWDGDLARLYEVDTKVLVQAVKRNRSRFPSDFMFQLTEAEFEVLRSQFVTSKEGRGGRRYRPYVFTEQGVAMLSSVLRSQKAVRVNIQIMRTFVKLRRFMETHEDLSRKIAVLERKYDGQFKAVFDALRNLMEPVGTKRRRIGFTADHSEK